MPGCILVLAAMKGLDRLSTFSPTPPPSLAQLPGPLRNPRRAVRERGCPRRLQGASRGRQREAGYILRRCQAPREVGPRMPIVSLGHKPLRWWMEATESLDIKLHGVILGLLFSRSQQNYEVPRKRQRVHFLELLTGCWVAHRLLCLVSCSSLLPSCHHTGMWDPGAAAPSLHMYHVWNLSPTLGCPDRAIST